MHGFHLEVLDSPRAACPLHTAGARHALSLAWDGPRASVVLRCVKAGSSFLWHDARGQVAGGGAPDTFCFRAARPLVLRVSVSLTLFWGVSSPTTTLYLSAARRDCGGGGGTSMAVKLVKIAGFSGWVTSLLVDDICETVELLLKFVEERVERVGSSGMDFTSTGDRQHSAEMSDDDVIDDATTTSAGGVGDGGVGGGDSPVFSTFSWHLLGTAPANSVLLWLVHALWHRLVMSAFLYEALQLWAGVLHALGMHVTSVAAAGGGSSGSRGSRGSRRVVNE